MKAALLTPASSGRCELRAHTNARAGDDAASDQAAEAKRRAQLRLEAEELRERQHQEQQEQFLKRLGRLQTIDTDDLERLKEHVSRSDDALASAFAEEVHGRFCRTPGFGWLEDDGTVWRRDDLMRRYAAARQVCRNAANVLPTKNPEKARLTSARTVQAVLTLAQADPLLAVDDKRFDADPLLLNTPGGVVDLARSTEVKPRGHRYVTQVTSATPVDASAPRFERFIDEVFCGDGDLIRFVQRMLGYSLTGDCREQALFFWHGDGANGKSVLADVVQRLMGTYAIKLPATALMQTKFERHPTELAQLRSRRFAVSSEVGESDFFNEALLKELTGDRVLRARFMRNDFFEFTMTHKHCIVGNYKPRLRGGDPAMARRMLLVPFNARFTGAARDPLMLEKLMAEGPAILHWLIQGALAWSSEGLAVPSSVRSASDEYLAAHDDLALWMDECCTRKGEARASHLYQSFRYWKEARGEHAPSQTAWGSRMGSVPGIDKRRNDGIWYTGIQLNREKADAPM